MSEDTIKKYILKTESKHMFGMISHLTTFFFSEEQIKLEMLDMFKMNDISRHPEVFKYSLFDII